MLKVNTTKVLNEEIAISIVPILHPYRDSLSAKISHAPY